MIVIDTSALFAILADEEDAVDLSLRITVAESCLISAATLVELGIVTCSRWRSDGIERLDGLLNNAVHPVIVPVDTGQARLAIEAHRTFGRGSGHPARLNYGDCFSYALAKSRDLPLLLKGDDFVHTDLAAALDRRPASG